MSGCEIVVELGRVNTPNANGVILPAETLDRALAPDGVLTKRVALGTLRSELGSPYIEPYVSTKSYIERFASISESNVCGTITEVKMVGEGADRRVMGVLKPSGPHQAHIEELLLQDIQPVFGIRAFTKTHIEDGKIKHVIQDIVTWDVIDGKHKDAT
jgi:hypothetical protein